MPLQRVVEPDALTDQALAVIDQQPQIELGPVQLCCGQLIQALAQRRPGDRDRVDAVGLPALAPRAPRRRHQPGRDANDALAANDQEPLKRSGDMPAILKRPCPLARQAPSPEHQRTEPASADRDRLLAQQLSRRRIDRGDRVRALVGVRTEHDH